MAEIWMDVDVALSEVPINKAALIDSGDFITREESVVFNQSGLDLLWNFVTTAGVFTQTAVTPTDTAGDYDWVNQGNGMYTMEIPASSGASINNDTEGFGWFSGFATGILPWISPIMGFRAAALNNAYIDGGDIPDVNVTTVSDTAQTGNDNGADINTLITQIGTAGDGLSALPNQTMNITGNLSGSVGSVTTVSDKTGYALSATGLDAISQAATGMVEIAKAIWDRILSGATHNIGSSAGRRVRQLQESGAVYNGQVWVDTLSGTAGTTSYENGTSDNHVNLWASALTIAGNVGLSDYHLINGSSITLTANSDNFSLFGDNWILALAGQSCVDMYVQGAKVSGVGVAASGEMHFEGCDVSTASVQTGHFDFCGFDGTVTHTLAGDYNYHDCYSKVAGAGAPTFTKTAGQAITAEFRRWSGGITISGLQSGDVVTVSGELGTVTLNGADATVEIRGTYKGLTNNLTGSPTVNTEGAINVDDITQDVMNTAIPSAQTAGSVWEILDRLDIDYTTDRAGYLDKLNTLGIPKNAAYNNFEFFIRKSSDHVTGETGLTLTEERSIDGGAFGACTNNASEVADGIYKINLSASDLNGDVITFKFSDSASSPTADATFLTVHTV